MPWPRSHRVRAFSYRLPPIAQPLRHKTKVMSSNNTVWQHPALQRHVVRELDNGHSEVMLLIDGMRCAGCVASLERALVASRGVQRVRINAASQRAHIIWDGTQNSLSALLDCIDRTGYGARPLDARALDDRRREEARDALKRLLVAGFGAMQAMMFATVLYVGAIDEVNATTRELFRWLGFMIATPVVMYSAKPFFSGAVQALRARRLGMDVPVALAIALVYFASLLAALHGEGEVYFDSVSMFVFFLLTGRYLEMRGRHRALDLTDALARLMPDVAQRRMPDGSLHSVPVLELQNGDILAVDSGTVIPADGVVQRGQARVDESMLTGESQPCLRQQGDALLAGSLLLDGPIDMHITRCGSDTTMAGMVSLVERAQAERPRLARVGEDIVARFVMLVLGLASLTALGWLLVAPERAFGAAVAVLVVSCPCAFALAVPAALTRALAVLARNGVLVAKPDAIEALARADHVVFDKTGTLTDGLSLQAVQLAADRTPQTLNQLNPAASEVLALAQALARESRHPVSRAIAAAAGQDAVPVSVEAIKNTPGQGLQAKVNGRLLRLGRASFASPTALPANIDDNALVLADEHQLLAHFHVSERLRPTAAAAVDTLLDQGLSLHIASGDQAHRVADIAARLAISDWSGGQLPADKLARLQQLRQSGACIIAVGDGINDAPVLAGADVSVAMGSGADLARASSDIVLASEDLGQLATARTIAAQSLRVVRQNQRWALAYNLLAIPLAAAGLVPPWLAALGMSASSLGVVLNALRIGRQHKPKTARVQAQVVTA